MKKLSFALVCSLVVGQNLMAFPDFLNNPGYKVAQTINHDLEIVLKNIVAITKQYPTATPESYPMRKKAGEQLIAVMNRANQAIIENNTSHKKNCSQRKIFKKAFMIPFKKNEALFKNYLSQIPTTRVDLFLKKILVNEDNLVDNLGFLAAICIYNPTGRTVIPAA